MAFDASVKVLGIGSVRKAAQIAVAAIVAVSNKAFTVTSPGMGFRGAFEHDKMSFSCSGSQFDTFTVRVKFFLQMMDKVSTGAIACRADPAVVVMGIDFVSKGKLFEIGKTSGGAGALPCRRQCRQQHCCQYSNDGNNNQQLDEGKSSILRIIPIM